MCAVSVFVCMFVCLLVFTELEIAHSSSHVRVVSTINSTAVCAGVLHIAGAQCTSVAIPYK